MTDPFATDPFPWPADLSEAVLQRAALAEVDGQPWDMHRPISAESCTLRYLYFRDPDPFVVRRRRECGDGV